MKYFDRFDVEHILKKIKWFIGNKNITADIYRIEAYDSIMCRYFYTEYVKLKGKTLLDYNTAFVLNKYKKKGKIILRCFR